MTPSESRLSAVLLSPTAVRRVLYRGTIKDGRMAVTLKACKTCGTAKPLTEYHRDARSSDGFRLSCKSCRNPRNASYKRAGKTVKGAVEVPLTIELKTPPPSIRLACGHVLTRCDSCEGAAEHVRIVVGKDGKENVVKSPCRDCDYGYVGADPHRVVSISDLPVLVAHRVRRVVYAARARGDVKPTIPPWLERGFG